jgi:hypothetical protein
LAANVKKSSGSGVGKFFREIRSELRKVVTVCGCIRINAEKQSFPNDINYSDLRPYMENHVEGKLCESCQDVIENEIGRTIFYLTALSNALDLDLNEVIEKERKTLEALGVYNLT